MSTISNSKQKGYNNMLVEVTSEMAYKMIRKDILDHLGYDGVDAILSHYNEENPEMIFDENLFSTWTKYSDALKACEYKNISYNDIEEELKDGFIYENWNDMSEEEQENAVYDMMVERLCERYNAIVLDSGEILIED